MANLIYTVKSIETLRDVAIRVYGSTQYLFKLANENGLNIDSDVIAGQELSYDSDFGRKDIRDKVSNLSIDINNKLDEENILTQPIRIFASGRNRSFDDFGSLRVYK